jgi:hypothetical protein
LLCGKLAAQVVTWPGVPRVFWLSWPASRPPVTRKPDGAAAIAEVIGMNWIDCQLVVVSMDASAHGVGTLWRKILDRLAGHSAPLWYLPPADAMAWMRQHPTCTHCHRCIAVDRDNYLLVNDATGLRAYHQDCSP